MRQRHILAAVFLALLAALAGSLALTHHRPPRGAPETTARPKSAFESPEEAFQYILTRLACAKHGGAAADPYAATLVRSYTTLDGKKHHYYLVAAPERELALAEGFEKFGFAREALVHYENLLAYYPDAPETKGARERANACRNATVLGMVPPLTVVVEDPLGRRGVTCNVEPKEALPLDRIHEFHLHWQPTDAPLKVVGFIDDAGAIIATEDDNFPKVLKPVDEPVLDHLVVGGGIAKRRFYYQIPKEAKTLFEAERLAKGMELDKEIKALGAATPENTPRYRILARALIYLSRTEEARGLLEKIGEKIENPLEGHLEAIAANPDHPLNLDTLWILKSRDNPSFTLTTKSAATDGTELPVDINAHAIDRIDFTFAALEGPFPAEAALVKEWFAKAPARTAYSESLPVQPGAQILQLPLRAPGSYRVTAEAQGMSCSFLAVRVDASLEVFAFPGETLYAAPKAGFSVSRGGKTMGTTDDEGLLSVRAGAAGTICDAHRECCATCESCLHHHSAEETVAGTSKVFVSGNGLLFRATAQIDTQEVAQVKYNAPGSTLMVCTDRPAYRAGDTMRFRGILRIPRAPLNRKDTQRLDPVPGREVTVAVRCGETLLFRRSYATNEWGTFNGEYTLPVSAARAEYVLSVEHERVTASRPFEVTDYRKSDFLVTLTPRPEGFAVQAGYVWGAPVPGAEIRATVDGNEAEVRDGVVAAGDGARVCVFLTRGDRELASKTAVFKATSRAREAKDTPAAPEPPAAESQPAAEAQEPAPFRVTTSKPSYGRGEEIEVRIEGCGEQPEATVVLGDVQMYDLVRVPVRDGRAVARFPVRPIHDPGVTVFALCNGLQAHATVGIRSMEMEPQIDAPTEGRPGEQVKVTVRADPHAAFSLAAVDEAIFEIREDDTPDLYGTYYPHRPAALAWARFADPEFDGEMHKVEAPPTHPSFKVGYSAGPWIMRIKGGYDVIGIAGGGGGCYGIRVGGHRELVSRGGGASDAGTPMVIALARLQKPDGSWGASYTTEAGVISDVGATGLGLLAFEGMGYSHLSKDTYDGICFGDVVRKSIQWLQAHQAPDGIIGAAEGDRILNHALATLALSEAYGLTGAVIFKDSAQNAVEALSVLQSTDGGWHRRDAGAGGEILSTVFAVMALRSAQLAELRFDASCAESAYRFLDRRVDENGTCGNPPTHATVGGSMFSFIMLRKTKSDPRIREAADWIIRTPLSWDRPDFLGWYLSSLGVYQYDGPSGSKWKRFSEPLREILVNHQTPGQGWTVGDQTMVPTALGLLVFEVYYRYASVFGCGGGRTNLPPLAPEPRVRLYFPDTAFWAPELVTDEKGEAQASFTLPDQITTLRLTARGITKTGAAGEAVERIATRQPFFARIEAPETLVAGDEVEVRVAVHNYTKASLKAIVSLEGSSPDSAIEVPVDRPVSASWRVRADRVGPLRLAARVEAGGRQDAVNRVVQVLPAGRERLVTRRGKSRTGESFPLAIPEGAREVVVKLHPGQGSMSRLLDALRYLNDYPYG